MEIGKAIYANNDGAAEGEGASEEPKPEEPAQEEEKKEEEKKEESKDEKKWVWWKSNNWLTN